MDRVCGLRGSGGTWRARCEDGDGRTYRASVKSGPTLDLHPYTILPSRASSFLSACAFTRILPLPAFSSFRASDALSTRRGSGRRQPITVIVIGQTPQANFSFADRRLVHAQGGGCRVAPMGFFPSQCRFPGTKSLPRLRSRRVPWARRQEAHP
eukprot:1779223-Prymnesium_polylepis.2